MQAGPGERLTLEFQQALGCLGVTPALPPTSWVGLLTSPVTPGASVSPHVLH